MICFLQKGQINPTNNFSNTVFLPKNRSNFIDAGILYYYNQLSTRIRKGSAVMSYAGIRYSHYSTFFSPIFPHEDYWDHQLHSHTTEELLLLVSEGSCIVDSNGNSYQIPTPAFIWNRAGSYHLVSNAVKGTRPSYVASFLPSILTDVPEKLRYDAFMQRYAMFALPLKEDQLYRLEALFQILVESPLPQRQLLLPCIFHQVTQYLNNGATPICCSSHYNYVFQVLSLLERSGCEKTTSRDLAKRFHVSKNKLEADFKKATGYTIHAFRMRIQLQTARVMLASTSQSLVQVATACGFTDESHLIRSFRKEYGMTPGAFRKTHKKDPRWTK